MLTDDFHAAMLNIYDEALRLKPPYPATRFRRMVLERGGLQAAKDLLETRVPSDGFTELFMRGNRLDISVEYLVLKHPWRTLFEPRHLEEARRRLMDRKFGLPPDDADAPKNSY